MEAKHNSNLHSFLVLIVDCTKLQSSTKENVPGTFIASSAKLLHAKNYDHFFFAAGAGAGSPAAGAAIPALTSNFTSFFNIFTSRPM